MIPQFKNSEVLAADAPPVSLVMDRDESLAASPSRVPLVVDLDRTLVRTDLLWESVVQLWRRPRVALQALLALLWRGKAGFKTVLAGAISVDPATLPYRDDVLEFARSQHAMGRDLVLATASHRLLAERVAEHLGLFCTVFATENGINLSADNKRDALVASYGKQGFDYIGDERKDLPIFAVAREALLVDPSAAVLKKASGSGNVSRVFSEQRWSAKDFARALRLHQWAKNVLLAVPLLTAHLVLNLAAWISFVTAFVAFGLVASATYLLNDLADLQADRMHAEKRFRPLASGRLPIPTGLTAAMVLGLLGFALAIAFLPSAFVAWLGIYVVLTLAYSLYLKRRLLVDVLTLAVLYTLRILAGAAAIEVLVSEWLLVFSLFIFLSLAFLKRAVELKGNSRHGPVAGRGYSGVDLETMRIVGISAGLMSVLVFSLYISSPAVGELYRSPQTLWLMCPLLIYWISRMWFLAARDHVPHDPVVFALVDWRSHVVGACALLTVLLAKIGPHSWAIF